MGNDAGGKLERAFWQFHADNPVVYQLLVRFAHEWAEHHAHCSINLLFERVRWAYAVEIRSDDGFRLNNNHRAFYARLLEERKDAPSGFFRMRQQRRQCSFGPRNEGLPPGEHHA